MDPFNDRGNLTNRIDGAGGVLLNGFYLVENSAGSFGRPGRKLFYLVGDHGKAQAGVSRPGSFNRGIQGQQPGLSGDGFNHFKDCATSLR